jgi:hypothetical protein
MSEFVPPGERCTMCDSRALNPTDAHPLCESHAARLNGDNSETEDTAEAESGDVDGGEAGSSDDQDQAPSPGAPLCDGVARVAETTYPPTVKQRDIWVNWILDADGRKLPVAPWLNGHAYPAKWSEDLPTEERPETDFETANRWAEFDHTHNDLATPPDAQSDSLGTGIILPPVETERADRLTLIDWDDVRDPETEEIHPVALEFINRYGGYVEVSTSGEGLHQFVLGELRERGKFIAPVDSEPFVGDDKPQVEIYDSGRNVAMTGQRVAGSGDDIRDGQDYIDELVSEFADAEKDAGHRRYDPATGADAGGDSDTHTGDIPAPESGEYLGPPADDILSTKPDDRSLSYHAVVESFYRGGGDAGGFAHIQNWRLEGFAAALGERDGLSKREIKRRPCRRISRGFRRRSRVQTRDAAQSRIRTRPRGG